DIAPLETLARCSSGFIWDNVLSHGLTFTNFGEGAFSGSGTSTWLTVYSNFTNGLYAHGYSTNGQVAFPNGPINIPHLQTHTASNYPGWDTSYNIPDVLRADAFTYCLTNADLHGASWPRLTMMHLPNDHTFATLPTLPTPTAEVADNDLALGRIVEAITKSS